MRDASDLLKACKKASSEAVEQSKPTGLTFGKVVSSSPLQISIDQKMTLSSAQLMLTRNVTTYFVHLSMEHITENESGGSGDSSFASHHHEYKGTKGFTVHNALIVGEEVVLLRMQGGQKYLVLDRVVNL